MDIFPSVTMAISCVFISVFSRVEGNGILSNDDFCEYLASHGEQRLALLESRRLLHNEDSARARRLVELALVLRRQHKHDETERYCESALELSEPGTEPYRIAQYELIKTYIIQEKYALAAFEIVSARRELNMKNDTAFQYLECIVDAHQYRIDSARAALDMLAGDPEYRQPAGELDSLFAWYTLQEFKNPLYAYLYSSVIPGAGHFYAGDTRKGIAALACMGIVSSAILYRGIQFWQGDSRRKAVYGMDIFLIAMLVWRRYYGGIRRTAYEAAALHNRRLQLEYQRRLRIIRDF